MKAKQNISIDEEILEKVKELAAEQGRSVSNMIEFLLRQALKDK